MPPSPPIAGGYWEGLANAVPDSRPQPASLRGKPRTSEADAVVSRLGEATNRSNELFPTTGASHLARSGGRLQ